MWRGTWVAGRIDLYAMCVLRTIIIYRERHHLINWLDRVTRCNSHFIRISRPNHWFYSNIVDTGRMWGPTHSLFCHEEHDNYYSTHYYGLTVNRHRAAPSINSSGNVHAMAKMFFTLISPSSRKNGVEKSSSRHDWLINNKFELKLIHFGFLLLCVRSCRVCQLSACARRVRKVNGNLLLVWQFSSLNSRTF